MMRLLEPFLPMSMSKSIVDKLRNGGYHTYYAVVNASKKDLSNYSGISYFKAEQVKALCRDFIESDEFLIFSFMDFIGENKPVKEVNINSSSQVRDGPFISVDLALNEGS
ncbi:MAG: hypothetical protein ACTSQY_10640 [Candidatus Odinarchaeia archaeon]